MNKIGSALLVFCCCVFAAAQEHAAHPAASKPATLMTGVGNLHHPVSTKNAQAQQFFDQGLRLIFAFNHDEAARSFQRAAELDPKLAIAYWGVAEAVGPNYNDPASDERFQAAHDAIQKAADLSETASPSEKAYIQAMEKRFPADPKADRRKAAEDYRDAMREVVKNFPDDLDAATLFAESGMNLHPWGLWHVDGTPEEGTEEVVATLESVIKRDPDHMGAVHYYIHAVEASRSPQRALAQANKLPAMAPGAGHLVHMPAHVYIRTGDYEAAVKTNQQAATVDRAYIKASGVHERQLSGSQEKCGHARRPRGSRSQDDAAPRGLHDHPLRGRRALSQMGFVTGFQKARSGNENRYRILAFLQRHGFGRKGQAR
jgi:tetratricopeptide (TPR) repeat protein